MKSPKRITKEILLSRDGDKWSALFISGSNLHPNPRLYKYDWWIYSINSKYESAEDVFFKPEHRLSTKDAYERMNQLKELGIRCAYVNAKKHRLGTSIWDYKALEKQYPGIEFAIAYDEDFDEPFEGHK